jgi:hypothetical protein
MRAVKPALFGVAVLATLSLSSCRSAVRSAALANDVPLSPPIPAVESVSFPALGPPAPAAPGITLTASDGTGLELTSLSTRAVLEGPLSFTEMRLVFANPTPRTLEGTFKIVLPSGASISRFALRIGDRWQEGEVVERQRARVAYEDFLHRKQDPALLEQSAGNEFSARVFPIRANAEKEILVSYSEELRGAAPYVVSLRGLPRLGNAEASATIDGANVPLATLRRTGWVPDEDFVVDRSAVAAPEGVRNGDLVLARVRPVQESHPEPLESAVVLFDTSASRALGLAEQTRALQQLAARIAETNPGARWVVACFDQRVDELFTGPVSGFGPGAIAKILERGAFGASDVGRALASAGPLATHIGASRVLLLSDGVATAGETDRAKLVGAARALAAAGIQRIDAIATGGIRDDGALRAIATAGLPHDGVVLTGSDDARRMARRLGEATRSGIAVNVEGASWWTPRRIDGAQAGDEFLVYAQLPPQNTVRVTAGDAHPAAMELRPVERPLLERAWAQAKIESLVDAEATADDVDAIRKQIVALSTSHRVLSPHTALLVLETEDDYRRLGIDHTSLVDILAVQGGRVALTHRADAVLAPGSGAKVAAEEPAHLMRQTPAPVSTVAAMNGSATEWGADIKEGGGGRAEQRVVLFGSGGLGLSGVGEGGGGAAFSTRQGHGRLGGGHAAPAPRIREGATMVSGRVPPEVIQRIVRQNFGRFRLCYENGLRQHPGLEGRVTVRFVIDTSGAVASAADGGSSLPDPAVVQCVVRGFGNLSFPQPEGGTVTVVYPIQFSPNGTSDAEQAPQSLALGPRAADDHEPEASAGPYSGRFAEVMGLLARRDAARAKEAARRWVSGEPGDVMALVALGEALEASSDEATAARAYGSIIDLFPSRADLRRMAGERLERLRDTSALELAADTYAKALEERPDHPSSHRMLAFALLKEKEYARAFDVAMQGLAHGYPGGRFAGVEQVLREDLGLIGAAWAHAEPDQREAIAARVRAAGGTVEDAPSLRFVLSWETDANDVDLHVRDASSDHAFYSHRSLASGGSLYADVTTGYGPECFTVRLPKSKRSPKYSLQAHYYSRGPMGYGMGKLEIVDHDGRGGLTFEERPFVVMNDQAFVELGAY